MIWKWVWKGLIVFVLVLLGAVLLPHIYAIRNEVSIENGSNGVVEDVRFSGFDKIKAVGQLPPGRHKRLLFLTAKQNSPLILSYRFQGKDYSQTIGQATQGMGFGRWQVHVEPNGTLTVETQHK